MFTRFAYLIVAHKSDLVFETLLKMIDNDHNDIFIHMDKKNKGFSEKYVNDIVSKSRVFFLKRKKVTWGGYSQVEAEFRLIKLATETAEYKYYHLLSGSDLPIKSQDEILSFFCKSEDIEFVGFSKYEDHLNKRVDYFYPLQEIVGRNIHGVMGSVQRALVLFQKFLCINRNRDTKLKFAKGCNWFSITGNLAKYIVDNEQFIRRIFKYTRNADEMFLQTLICNSQFRNKVYNAKGDDNAAALRYVIFENGNSKVLTILDFEKMVSSPCFFARKFNSDIDSNVINRIYSKYCL